MPRRLTERRLADSVGAVLADPATAADVVAHILGEWGGHCLPRLSTFDVKHRERDRRVRALVDAGLSYRAAAERVTADGFPCSKSQAERIASRA